MEGDGTIPISDSILFWTPVCHVANVCAYYNPSSLLQVHADHPVDILPLREKLLYNSEQVFRRIASRCKKYLVYSFHLDLSGGLRITFC